MSTYFMFSFLVPRNLKITFRIKYFQLFSNICNNKLEFIDINKTKFMDKSDYKKFLNVRLISELIKLTLNDKIFQAFAELHPKRCKWLGEHYNCSKILSYTLTSQGWCRTFNNLHHDEIYIKPR